MNVGSLFSGIGGMDYGLARAGFSHRFFCESDEWRRSVLAHHWPGVPIYEDVLHVGRGGDQPRPRIQPAGTSPFRDGSRSVADGTADVRLADGRRERQVVGRQGEVVDSRQTGKDASPLGVQDASGLDSPLDLLCGGFPCQDLSVAGNRAGLAGSRSGLFFEFARIIDALRPRWVLVENVPGLLSSNGGRDFGIVLGTLADIGYGVGWRVLDSRFFGVPQRRRRVFILATVADGDPRAAAERAGQVLAVGSRCTGHPEARGETRADVAVASISGLGNGGPDDNDGQAGRLVAPALVKRYGKGSDSNATDAFVVADTLREHPRPGSNSNGALITHALTSEGADASEDGTGRGTPLAVTSITLASDPISAHELAQPSTKRNGDPGVIQSASQGVRRLTPTECERLQALPDGWTDHGPDSRRYAALGDAVTSTVAEWIGRRLIAATERPTAVAKPKEGPVISA